MADFKKTFLSLAVLLCLLFCVPCRAQDAAGASDKDRLEGLLMLGDFASAIGLAQGMLDKNPDEPATLLALARAYSMKGDFDRPIAFYRMQTAYTAADEDALFDLATALQAKGRTDEAMETFQRLLALFPERTDAYIAMAQIQASRHDFNMENSFLRLYMDAGGRPENALYPDTIPYGRRYYYRLARRFFRHAARAAPHDPAVFRAFGRHYLKLSRIYSFEINREKAVEMLKKSLALDPMQGEVCFDIASVYREREELGPAREYFERSLELGTARSFDAYFALGDAALAGLDAARAGHYFALCRKLVPMSPHARERLGRVAVLEGQSAQARDALAWLRAQGETALARDLDAFIAQRMPKGAKGQ